MTVGVAVRSLPKGRPRDRYHQEILAELHGMPQRRQAVHLLGVLGSVWSLRAALTSQVRIDKGEIMKAPRRPFGCRLNMHHAWRIRSTEDGFRFRQCARCGKHQDVTGANIPMVM